MAEVRELVSSAVTLREAEAARVIMLRLRKPTPQALIAIDKAIGITLPRQSNTASGTSARAIWMGPDEWMLIDPPVDCETLQAIPGSIASLAVDVGDGRYALDVDGDRARDFLAKSIPIDMHPNVFPVDHSAMTLFAQIPVVIDHSGANRFRLWFDVSLREFVRGYCRDALIEFQL